MSFYRALPHDNSLIVLFYSLSLVNIVGLCLQQTENKTIKECNKSAFIYKFKCDIQFKHSYLFRTRMWGMEECSGVTAVSSVLSVLGSVCPSVSYSFGFLWHSGGYARGNQMCRKLNGIVSPELVTFLFETKSCAWAVIAETTQGGGGVATPVTSIRLSHYQVSLQCVQL